MKKCHQMGVYGPLMHIKLGSLKLKWFGITGSKDYGLSDLMQSLLSHTRLDELSVEPASIPKCPLYPHRINARGSRTLKSYTHPLLLWSDLLSFLHRWCRYSHQEAAFWPSYACFTTGRGKEMMQHFGFLKDSLSKVQTQMDTVPVSTQTGSKCISIWISSAIYSRSLLSC